MSVDVEDRTLPDRARALANRLHARDAAVELSTDRSAFGAGPRLFVFGLKVHSFSACASSSCFTCSPVTAHVRKRAAVKCVTTGVAFARTPRLPYLLLVVHVVLPTPHEGRDNSTDTADSKRGAFSSSLVPRGVLRCEQQHA